MNRITRSAFGVIASAAFVAVGLPTTAVADDVVHVRERESIQAAIDAAEPGTKIKVSGDHAEQIWINKDGIELSGNKATLSMPDEPNFDGPCGPTLICVISPTANFEDPFDPANSLHDVTISGFTASNPFYDTIGAYWVDGLTIERNTVTGSGCTGIWVLFGNDFHIERNNASASVNCSTIDVAASSDGNISRNTATDGGFTGINLDDVSDVAIDRNTATGNCIGIAASDSPGDLPSSNVSITRNEANENNTVCYPFGPPDESPPIGVAGILVAGPDNVTVERNTASNNVSELATVTPGGIVITDFPNPDGTPQITGETLVERNTAEGNMTAAGPLDINVNSVGGPITVNRNRCGFGAPDPSWCTD